MKTLMSKSNFENAIPHRPEICQGPITVAGEVPLYLPRASEFQPVVVHGIPDFARLPRPRDRCQFSGLARTTLIELNASQPRDKQFLVKLRRRGYQRGSVLISVPRLLALLREATAEQLGTNIITGGAK
jgi:hypothetical protein